MRRTAVWAAAVLVGLGAWLVPAGPAAADGMDQFCFQLDNDAELECVPVYVVELKPKPGPDPCLTCPWLVDLKSALVLPVEVQHAIDGGLATGLHELGEAARTTDRRLASAHRARALDAFTAAGRAAGTTRVSVEQVGFLNRDGVFGPTPDPWLAGAALDTVDGLGLVQQSLNTRDAALAARLLEEAQYRFDRAYVRFSTKR